MKIILFGATGMVGQGVLRECLLDKGVSDVYAVGRNVTGQQHHKLHEVMHRDFTDFSTLKLDADAIFWCLGITSVGMSEPDYTCHSRLHDRCSKSTRTSDEDLHLRLGNGRGWRSNVGQSEK